MCIKKTFYKEGKYLIGFPAPNYTQTPNDLFDKWLPKLSESELKVLLVIMRKTFGWHKKRDRISITQLSTITGLLRETVINATKSLQRKGMIIKEVIGQPGKQETYYELVVTEDSNNSYQSVEPTPLVGLDPLGSTDPQKKLLPKETIQKKQQQAEPVNAAVPSKSSKKEKVYPCLFPIDIPLYDKIEITRTYELSTVINAIEWAGKQESFTKGLVAAIKHACKRNIKHEEPKPKETPYEKLCKVFKHGEKYNGAECHLKPDAVAFTRVMKHQQMNIDKYFKWENFNKMCQSFGIDFHLG